MSGRVVGLARRTGNHIGKTDAATPVSSGRTGTLLDGSVVDLVGRAGLNDRGTVESIPVGISWAFAA